MSEEQEKGSVPDVFAYFENTKPLKSPFERMFGVLPKIGDKSQLQGRVTDMSDLQTNAKGTFWVDFIVRAFMGEEDGYHNFRCIAFDKIARNANLSFPVNASVIVWGKWTTTRRREVVGGAIVERKTLRVHRGYDLKTRAPQQELSTLKSGVKDGK